MVDMPASRAPGRGGGAGHGGREKTLGGGPGAGEGEQCIKGDHILKTHASKPKCIYVCKHCAPCALVQCPITLRAGKCPAHLFVQDFPQQRVLGPCLLDSNATQSADRTVWHDKPVRRVRDTDPLRRAVDIEDPSTLSCLLDTRGAHELHTEPVNADTSKETTTHARTQHNTAISQTRATNEYHKQ